MLSFNRSQQAALQYKIESKRNQLSDVNKKIRQVKQRLIKTESELTYTNLDTLKEELTKVEEKIKTEEAQNDTRKVRNIRYS